MLSAPYLYVNALDGVTRKFSSAIQIGGETMQSQKANNYRKRAYVIPYFINPKSGKINVLLGREAFVHQRAQNEMLKILGSTCKAAIRQREFLKKAIDERWSFLGTEGRPLGDYPWRGINFGGVLLCGRPAFAGGRVERDDASVESAAAREMMEEFHMEELICGLDAHELIRNALRPLTVFKRPISHVEEHYFTLDLDTVFIDGGPDQVSIDVLDVLTNFGHQQAEAEKSNQMNTEEWEKRELFYCAAEELDKQFGDELNEEYDGALMRIALQELATNFCRVVLADFTADTVDFVTDELMKFQRSRRMPGAKHAIEKFLASPIVKK